MAGRAKPRRGRLLVNKITPDLSGAAGTGATPEPPRKDPPPDRDDARRLRHHDRWPEFAQGTEQHFAGDRHRAVRDQLTAIGPEVGPDAKGITWRQVRTADNQLGWVAVKIGSDATVSTSAPAPVQVTSAVPWGKCLAGWAWAIRSR